MRLGLQDIGLCNNLCLQQMQSIRQKVQQAVDTQNLIQGIISLIGFLVRL